VKNPVDLSLVQARIKAGDYYRNRYMLQADLNRMVANCKAFNAAGTDYYEAAERFSDLLPKVAEALAAQEA